MGTACNNLGVTLEETGDLPAAARALVQGLEALQRVERDVGAHDDQRVSLFEQQQNTYRSLQSVLLGLGQPEWALGVAAQAKARALLYHLAAGSGEHRGEHDASSGIEEDGLAQEATKSDAQGESGEQPTPTLFSDPLLAVGNAWTGLWSTLFKEEEDGAKGSGRVRKEDAPGSSYEDVCEAWWREVQADARAEGDAGAARIVEYSFLFDDRLAIWVLSGSGELLGSTTVPTSGLEGSAASSEGGGHTILALIAEARDTMKVRGRDAMMREAEGRDPVHAVAEDARSGKRGGGGRAERAKNARDQLDAIIKREQAGLAVLYQHLLAPVAAHLEGAAEVLIVPHKELSEVPWAALFDSQAGQYLIERHVLRVAPSLRVVREAAGTGRHDQTPGTHASEERPGRSLVVGNPLPNRLGARGELPDAETEAGLVVGLLTSVGVEVDALMRGAADKAAVLDKIQGAAWAHFACHGDLDTKSLVLAISASGDPMSEPLAACPQDHAMQSLTSSSSWMCDVCKKDMTGNPHLRCDECSLSCLLFLSLSSHFYHQFWFSRFA